MRLPTQEYRRIAIYGALFLALTVGTYAWAPLSLSQPLASGWPFTLLLLVYPAGRGFNLFSGSSLLDVVQHVITIAVMIGIFQFLIRMQLLFVSEESERVNEYSTFQYLGVLVHQYVASALSLWVTHQIVGKPPPHHTATTQTSAEH